MYSQKISGYSELPVWRNSMSNPLLSYSQFAASYKNKVKLLKQHFSCYFYPFCWTEEFEWLFFPLLGNAILMLHRCRLHLLSLSAALSLAQMNRKAESWPIRHKCVLPKATYCDLCGRAHWNQPVCHETRNSNNSVMWEEIVLSIKYHSWIEKKRLFATY